MDIKPTFVNRQINKQNKAQPFDAVKLINYFLSLHPLNKLIVNSPLYLAAVKQYNSQIKNTLIRPPIPAWFCGKINQQTNELIPTPTDREQRAVAGVVKDNPYVAPVTIPQDPKLYIQDMCLQIGTPGSAAYLTCNAASIDDDRDVGGLGWQPTNGGNVTCAKYIGLYFDLVSGGLVKAAWPVTKNMIINLGLRHTDQLASFDDAYLNPSEATVNIEGPMSGSGKSCETVDETTTKIKWTFTWFWEGRYGTVQSSVDINNEDGAVVSAYIAVEA